tara:strand:+ start:406 stop:1440 length:1035 start_codon:yes stop_codon:yes gene_type:complete
MKKILFFDAVAPYEYNYHILQKKGLGASESYLLAVANELKKNFDVDIATTFVKYNYTQNDIVFKKLNLNDLGDNYDIIFIQRNPQNLKILKEKYPNAKFFIWLHDFFESSIWASLPQHDLQYICDHTTLLCVSEWHRNNFKINLLLRKINDPKIEFIHFFIDDDLKLAESNIKVDPNKLCFFSAGHKGLEFTLKIFEHLYRMNNEFKLYIGNPTYDQDYKFDNNNGSIVNLKNQPRNRVLWHMKGSLATLHLNDVYPETFGCVNAESNMVGTPVLCFDIGATKEILYNPNEQLIQPNPHRVDLHNLTYITEKIMSWKNGFRPEVKLNPKFHKEIIMKKWIEILS